ncbi:hypothetical protein [Stenotrophomonas sp. 24(2023)]|uniref:hypothetical protein n=1 Tax=Stenotrophomonas sp. 24(2023) TaxID=3068324 RepID=UPI0027DF64FA|nr:hypothetical protein [Stenotrophomonas sp. 24(2023)]WMJ69251.1 hypothetical protein Q9R17_19075 [Stenotrophomonas sp. 24(2023)]
MTDPTHAPLPSTAELLRRLQLPPASRGGFKRAERWFMGGSLVAIALIGLIVTVTVTGWVVVPHARAIVALLYLVLLLGYTVCVALSLVEIVRHLRRGFSGAAANTDRAIARSGEIIASLAGHPRPVLREQARLLELEAKSCTRRAALGAALNTLAAVALNLVGAFAQAGTPALPAFVPMMVYALMTGALIGSALLGVYGGRLEKLAGLYQIAADRP